MKVRLALDRRDSRDDRRHESQYRILSELAANPSMQSGHLMRPRKDGDLKAGPFVEPQFLGAVLCEMARVADLVGEVLARFLPETWVGVLPARAAFSEVRRAWLASYSPSAGRCSSQIPVRLSSLLLSSRSELRAGVP